MDYDTYINSESWKKLREQRLILSGRRCEACKVKGVLLHAHHMNYRDLTDCTVDDLVTLCEVCHRILHLELKQMGIRSKDLTRAKTIAVILKSVIPPKKKLTRKQRRALIKSGAIPRHHRRNKHTCRMHHKHTRPNRAIDNLVTEIQKRAKDQKHLAHLILNYDAD